MPTNTFYALLNGVNFRPRESRDRVESLDFDTELRLEREPDNAYHGNAIKVMEDEMHLGYVEADVANDIAERLDNDEPHVCTVAGRQGRKLELLIQFHPASGIEEPAATEHRDNDDAA